MTTEVERLPRAGAQPTEPDLDEGLHRHRRAAPWKAGFLLLLTVVVVLGLLNVLGMRMSTTAGRQGDVDVELTYASVSRGGLPTPWLLRIRKPGGFDGPVDVRVLSSYLDLFSRNGIDPQPASETTDGEWLVWTFDTPPGSTFTVSLDMEVQGSIHWGRDGRTEVRADGEDVTLTYHTWIVP